MYDDLRLSGTCEKLYGHSAYTLSLRISTGDNSMNTTTMSSTWEHVSVLFMSLDIVLLQLYLS